MKKILILITLIITVQNVIAQQSPAMELKPNGFVGQDSTKNYVVIDVSKLNKADLYKKTLVYLNGIYKNPGKVLSLVENESITINGFTDEIKGDQSWYKYPTSYNIKLQFKDGKIKFEPTIVEFSEVWSSSDAPRKYFISSDQSTKSAEINCIYMVSKNTNKTFLFRKTLKASFDNWINNYITGLVKGINDVW